MGKPILRAPSLACLLLLLATGEVAAQFDDNFAGPNRCTCHCCNDDKENGGQMCGTAVMDAPNRGACNKAECGKAFEECAEASSVEAFFHDCECSCTHEGHVFKQTIAVQSAAECSKEACATQIPTYCDEASHISPSFLDCDCGCCEDGCLEPYVHTVGAGAKEQCTPDLCRGLLFQCPARGEGDVEAMYLKIDASGSREDVQREDPIPSLMPGVTDNARNPEVVVPDCVCVCDGAELTIFTGSVATCTERICSAVLAPCSKEGVEISVRHEVGGKPAGFAQLLSQQVEGLAAWEVVLMTLGIVALLVLIVLGVVCIVRSVKAKRYQHFDKDMVNVSLPDTIVTNEVDNMKNGASNLEMAEA